jgi:polyisoprenoid-binding protein YceI
VDITVDAASIDVGLDRLNEHIKTADMLDVAKYPTATYKGKLTNFKGDAPSEVDGELTLHGVTRPVKLTINSFLCKAGRGNAETCGADASATINRADFGIDWGNQFGYKMDVTLAIQIEARQAN